MNLRPALPASTIGVLIVAVSTIPSFAADEATPREEIVSEASTTPSPEADEPTPSQTADTESASDDQPEEDNDEEDTDTPTFPEVEELLGVPATPTPRPSARAAPPSLNSPEATVTLETFNSTVVEANGDSSVSGNDDPLAATNHQSSATGSQNSGQANGEGSNSGSGNASSAQTQIANAATAPRVPTSSPLNLPRTPAQNVPPYGTDVLAQGLLDSQDPDDNAPTEEFTTGTSEAPGRIESRRIIQPDQAADEASQDSVPEPPASPEAPQHTPSVPQDNRSAPQDHLVTTGFLSVSLALGGALLIASGIALLSWRNRTRT